MIKFTVDMHCMRGITMNKLQPMICKTSWHASAYNFQDFGF